MQEIQVIRASEDAEFEAVYDIRRKVFIEEQHVPESEEYDGYEAVSHHYLVVKENKPLACARWRITPYHSIKLERFAVLSEFRKSGIGALLLHTILKDLPEGYPVYLHAQESAVPFYAKQGFIAEGERFFECEIPHFRMYWKKEKNKD